MFGPVRSMSGGACPPISTSLGTNPDTIVVMLHGCRSALALKTGASPGRLHVKRGTHTGPSRLAAAAAKDIRASSCDVTLMAADQQLPWLVKSFTSPCGMTSVEVRGRGWSGYQHARTGVVSENKSQQGEGSTVDSTAVPLMVFLNSANT